MKAMTAGERFEIEGRRICVCGDPSAERWVILPVDGRELDGPENGPERIFGMLPEPETAMAAVEVLDWNAELTPWRTDDVPGRNGFDGRASELLQLLEEKILPELERGYCAAQKKRILAGYSLAGLFALWACSKSGGFSAAAAMSPSVWYPGWLQFAEENRIRAEAVYLSLGDREEKTKNRLMASVGDAIRQQYRILQDSGICCTLEWNPGNHFQNTEKRIAAGIAWSLQTIRSQE